MSSAEVITEEEFDKELEMVPPPHNIDAMDELTEKVTVLVNKHSDYYVCNGMSMSQALAAILNALENMDKKLEEKK